jgi:aquaporin related protein
MGLVFLFFSYGIATIAGQQGITATTGDATALNASQLQYSALGFGFALAVNAWCFYRVSGGLFK